MMGCDFILIMYILGSLCALVMRVHVLCVCFHVIVGERRYKTSCQFNRFKNQEIGANFFHFREENYESRRLHGITWPHSVYSAM